MAFREADAQGVVYAPGYFLAHEECVRLTQQIAQAGATEANGGKYVKAGTPWPANNSSIVGLVYEDVDVTAGNMPGSVVMKGVVYEDRLPVTLISAAKNALIAKGFVFATSPSVTRPKNGNEAMGEITVVSAAGTAVGDTALTLSGYTPGSGESYMYKVGDTAPTIAQYAIPDDTWTEWDGDDDITAATGKKITVVSVDADGRVVALGSTTVTAKA